MSATRHSAWSFIKNNPGLNVQQLVDLNADNGNCILVVIRFYQKLYYNRVNRRMSERLVFELFGDVFYVWYYGFLETKLVPLGWKNGENLENLAKLFEADLSSEVHAELKQRKRQQALRDLENR